jgi:hypothetical protein
MVVGASKGGQHQQFFLKIGKNAIFNQWHSQTSKMEATLKKFYLGFSFFSKIGKNIWRTKAIFLSF